MPSFPKISLRPEVEHYLRNVFKNTELLDAFGLEGTEQKFEALLTRLSQPPGFTTVRLNTHLASVECIRDLLSEEIQKGEVIAMDKIANKLERIKQNAALLQLKCIKAYCFNGTKALATDTTGSSTDGPPFSPESFDRILLDAPCSGLGQRPNMACTWSLKEVLSYQPLQRKLFTVGEVIAMDKIANKLERIKQNAALLQLKCIKAYCFRGTKALATDATGSSTDGPPFSPESFDRILLDAPCSGLGQRPNMACTWSLKVVLSYQLLQRKLFTVAVKLLKPGGVLVYSTCTITLAENEEQVAWALQTFPCLRLQPQEPHLGGEGMMGACLSRDQLKQLQRFDPGCVPAEGLRFNPEEESSQRTEADFIQQANKDTIGFFIAKFVKVS
ncbi:UNVERIFIED_CONTAM: hypothetical protein FKN15_060664 [Acipenser sinensis]